MSQINSIFRNYHNRFKAAQFLIREIEKNRSKENTFDQELAKALGDIVTIAQIAETKKDHHWVRV